MCIYIYIYMYIYNTCIHISHNNNNISARVRTSFRSPLALYKNTQERTADAKPPCIYIGSFREVGGRAHSSQNYLTAKNLK